MTSLKRAPHNMHIARTIKSIITTSIRHLNQLLLDALASQLGWVHEVGATKLLCPGLLAIIHIHNDDFPSLVFHRSLNDGKTDAAGAKDSDVGALLDTAFSGSDDGSTVAGCDTTAEQACAVHGCLFSNGDDGDVGDDGVLGESGGAHEVQEVLALAFEARGAVGHDAAALGGADLAAEVRLSRFAELAFAELGGAGGVLVNV